MIERRTFVLCGCASAVPAGSAFGAPGLSTELEGCGRADLAVAKALEAVGVAAGSGQSVTLYATTGDTRVDRALGALLADIAGRFRIRPGFAIYDDTGAPNAVALPLTAFPGTSGTVLFGKTLMATGLGLADVDQLLVVSVCAHEFGHVLQNTTSFRGRLMSGQTTVRSLELHADFLAGFYLAIRGTAYRPRQLVDLGKSWERLGDSNYTNPQHHGAPLERIRAIEQGYRLGRERPALGPLDVCEVGARYLGA